TARSLLRRVARLLGEGRAASSRIAATISSLAARGRRSPPAGPRRQGPLAFVREDPKTVVAGKDPPQEMNQPLPEGHLVARVAGEEAAFEAPIPLVEERLPPPLAPAPSPPPLPAAYHDDAFTAIARDPFTLWLYWDFSPETVQRAMEGLTDPRTKLRVYQGAHRFRDVDFALESGSYYVNDLSPGETYQAEIVF